MKRKKAFTLIEIMIVVVIVGVLMSLAILNFSGSVEKAAKKEACINLEMIVSAVEIYQMNKGAYPEESLVANAAAINTNLKTNLPVSAAKKWEYVVDVDAGATPPHACVEAQRQKTGSTLKYKLCTNPAITGSDECAKY